MASKVTINITAKDNASAAFARVSASAETLGEKFHNVGKRMAITGGLMTAAFTAPIAKGFKDAISAASDFQETLSKTKVIFGNQATALESWAKTGAKAFGQSQTQALDAASTFGIFGQSAKLTDTKLADFSKSMTVLASDLASFSNTKPEDAILALGAALRGENEPIRRYGVLLDANTLKARAASMGIITLTVDQNKLSLAQERVEKVTRKVSEATKKFGADSQQAKDATRDQEQAAFALATVMEGKYPTALTSAQKVLAAQAEILAQTTLQQGDFTRTSEGLANQQRILAAEFSNAKKALGDQLLPYALKAVEVFRELVARFDALSPSTQKFVIIGAALLAVLGPLLTIIGGLATVLSLPLVAFVALSAAAVYAYRNFESFRAVVDGVVSWLRTNVPAAFERVKTDIVTAITVARQMWDQNWSAIKTVAEGVFTAIKGVVQGGMAIIKGVIQSVMGIIRGDWSTTWNGLKTVASGFVTAVTGIIKGLGPLLWSAMVAALNLLNNALTTGFNAAVSFVRGIPAKIVAALGNLGSLLVSAGGHVIDGFVNGMKAKLPSVRSAAAAIANTATGGLTGFLGIKSPSTVMHGFGEDTAQGFINGIKSMAGRVAAAAEQMGQTFRDAIGGAMGGYNAGKGKRSAERGVADATRDLNDARNKSASLPGRIAAAEKRLADARANGTEVTAEEQSAIEDATKALEEARVEYVNGTISAAKYQVAVDKLRRVTEAATESSNDAASIERELDELRRESVSNASDLERAELALVEAQDRLAEATISAYEAQQDLIGLGDEAIDTWMKYALAAGVAADQVERMGRAMRGVAGAGMGGGLSGGLPIVPPGVWDAVNKNTPGGDIVDFWKNLYGGPTVAYASGGFVRARPGGQVARLGEGGQDEIVSPVPMLREIVRTESGGGGGDVYITVQGNVMDGRDLARQVTRGFADAGLVRPDGTIVVHR